MPILRRNSSRMYFPPELKGGGESGPHAKPQAIPPESKLPTIYAQMFGDPAGRGTVTVQMPVFKASSSSFLKQESISAKVNWRRTQDGSLEITTPASSNPEELQAVETVSRDKSGVHISNNQSRAVSVGSATVAMLVQSERHFDDRGILLEQTINMATEDSAEHSRRDTSLKLRYRNGLMEERTAKTRIVTPSHPNAPGSTFNSQSSEQLAGNKVLQSTLDTTTVSPDGMFSRSHRENSSNGDGTYTRVSREYLESGGRLISETILNLITADSAGHNIISGTMTESDGENQTFKVYDARKKAFVDPNVTPSNATVES